MVVVCGDSEIFPLLSLKNLVSVLTAHVKKCYAEDFGAKAGTLVSVCGDETQAILPEKHNGQNTDTSPLKRFSGLSLSRKGDKLQKPFAYIKRFSIRVWFYNIYESA